MRKDEALKLALEFIENSECGTADLEARIKEALAQPEQEPVKWCSQCGHKCPLPPQRTWVEMTDEEIDVIDEATWDEDHKSWDIHGFARGIEAKLKEKNT